VGALTACWLLTAAWYRWRDRRTGGQTRLRGYLVTGLALAAVTAALPLLAWGIQIDDGSAMQAWAWLDAFWRLGTFALLAIAVSLGMLARIGRSRALAVITAIYTAAVCLTGWLDCSRPSPGPPTHWDSGTLPSCRPQPFCCWQAWAPPWRPACISYAPAQPRRDPRLLPQSPNGPRCRLR
jgi:hypothetical protein